MEKRNITTKALKIVNWFRVKNYADMKVNGNAEPITQMKVMKLLYYVQGVSLALYNQPAFDEQIMAWRYGPAVKSVHKAFRGCRDISLNDQTINKYRRDYKDVQDNKYLSNVVNSVNNAYGDMSAIDLMKETHREDPWIDTLQSHEIKPSIIRDYFIKNVISW